MDKAAIYAFMNQFRHGVISSTSSNGTPQSALVGIAEVMAAIDPDRVARLVTDAERIALSTTDITKKVSALSRVAGVLVATDPDRAAR